MFSARMMTFPSGNQVSFDLTKSSKSSTCSTISNMLGSGVWEEGVDIVKGGGKDALMVISMIVTVINKGVLLSEGMPREPTLPIKASTLLPVAYTRVREIIAYIPAETLLRHIQIIQDELTFRQYPLVGFQHDAFIQGTGPSILIS